MIKLCFKGMKGKIRAIIITFVLLLLPFVAYGLSPETRLKDELQEQRAMNLFLQVRCLVCSGQVIENSDTEFALAMRQLIRQKILENKSDTQIKADLVSEFGKDILNEVTLKNTALLWYLPILFMAVILTFGLKFLRIRKF
jgi:cytochrome c-type biogenesis protein CcmH